MTAYHIGTPSANYYAKPLPLSSSPSWASDAVTLTESGSSGVFSFDNDSTKPYIIYLRAGGSPSDTDEIVNTLAPATATPADVSPTIDFNPTIEPTELSAGSISDIRSGLATSANVSDAQTAITTELGAIKGATFDTSTDSLEAIRNRGDAAWITGSGGGGGSGEGAYQLTIPIRNSADDALAGARVSIVGTTLVQTTGTNGNAVFNVDGAASPGVTYTVRVMAPSGYVSPNDFTVTVLQVDKTADDVVLTAANINEPENPGECACEITVRSQNNVLVSGASVTATIQSDDAVFVSQSLIINSGSPATTNVSGKAAVTLIQGQTYRFVISLAGREVSAFEFTAPNETTAIIDVPI